MGRIVGILIIVLGGIAGLAVAAVARFGWIAVAVIVVLVLLTAIAGKKLFFRLLLLPFKAKGDALQGAALTVHGVDFHGKGEGGFRYELDLTLTPARARQGAFRLWEPDSLSPVPAGSKAKLSVDSGDESIGTVEAVRLWTGSGWSEPEEGKLEGAQRLKLSLVLEQPQKEIGLRYYFTDLGTVRLGPPKGKL